MVATFTGDLNATPVYVDLAKSSAALEQRSSGTVKPNADKAIGFQASQVKGGIPLTSPSFPFPS